MKLLGVPIEHKFACDIDRWAKKFIMSNCQPVRWYDNCLDPHRAVPEVDVYVAGFPCQSFSRAGKNLGMEDARGGVFNGVADFIGSRQPAVFILENVKNLASKTHKSVFDDMLRRLSFKGKYSVAWKVLNSKDFGVPQNRPRIYIVGCRCDRVRRQFVFPESNATPPPPIMEFLGIKRMDKARCQSMIDRDLRCMGQTASGNLRWALQHLDSDVSNADVVVDLGTGQSRNMMDNLCPTITRTRAGSRDFYLVSAARRLTTQELWRLQGMSMSDFDVQDIPEAAKGHLAGNAMTIPVLAAVLRSALLSVGLVESAGTCR